MLRKTVYLEGICDLTRHWAIKVYLFVVVVVTYAKMEVKNESQRYTDRKELISCFRR